MDLKPFDKLDETQQRCCIDIAIGVAIIAARLPTFGKEVFNAISGEWAASSELDSNLCRYSLKGVTNELYTSNWEFHVKKEGESMVCQFIKRAQPDRNGEIALPQ